MAGWLEELHLCVQKVISHLLLVVSDPWRDEGPVTRLKPQQSNSSGGDDTSSKVLNNGGKHDGAGRPMGSLSKTEFDRLVCYYRRQFSNGQLECASLTLVQLRQCIKHFYEVQVKLLQYQK